MAITFHKSRDERRLTELGYDKMVMTNRFYNADKSVEKFITVYNDPEMEVDPSYVLNDPTFTGFKLYFHFSATSGLLADEEYPNSALAYLKRIGDTARYNMLVNFIETLSSVNSTAPWIFSEIDGLADIFTSGFENVNVPKDARITIKCFETIDNKMTALNMLWRNIYYDKNRKVHVLPENMRQFSMSIYIIDMRVFNTSYKFLRNAATAGSATSLTEVNHMLFDIGMCEFDTLSGGSYLDSLSNASPVEATSNIVLKYGAHDVSSLFTSITGDERLAAIALELAANSTRNVAKPKFSVKGLAKDMLAKAKDKAENYINDLIDVDRWKTKLTEYAVDEATSRVTAVQRDLERLFYGNLQNFQVEKVISKLQDTLPLTGKFGSPTLQEMPSLQYDTKRLPGPGL